MILLLLLHLLSPVQSTTEFTIEDEVSANTLLTDFSTNSEFLPLDYSNSRSPTSATPQFQFVSSGQFESGFLHLQSDTGKLYSRRQIDRDTLCTQIEKCCEEHAQTCTILLKVAAISGSDPIIRQVVLSIRDRNDHAPQFQPRFVNLSIPESAPGPNSLMLGSSRPLPLAEDPDSDIFSVKQYRLEPSSHPVFGLETQQPMGARLTPSLRLKQPLDREKVDHYTLTVLAIDGGSPSLTGSLTVNVAVLDVNDNPPQFDQDKYRVEVAEGRLPNEPLLTVTATDRDRGENADIVYKLEPTLSTAKSLSMFRLESRTGRLHLVRPLDYERRRQYRLVVQASNTRSLMLGSNSGLDRVGAMRGLASTATVTVLVQNRNDEKPQIQVDYLSVRREAIVKENVEAPVFLAFLSVTDKDEGAAGAVSCRLDPRLDPIFELRLDNGASGGKGGSQYKLFTRLRLDRELKNSYSVLVTCTDSGSPALSNETVVTVIVADENDNQPKLRMVNGGDVVRVKENAPVGSVIGTMRADDPDDGENSRLRYQIMATPTTLLPDIGSLIQIQEDSGMISTVTVIDREASRPPLTSVPFLLVVTDRGRPKALSVTAQMRLLIEDENDNIPQFPAAPSLGGSTTVIRFTVIENGPPNQKFGPIDVTDADDQVAERRVRLSLSYRNVNYEHNPFILTEESPGLLGGGSGSGYDPMGSGTRRYWLSTSESLDRERQANHSLLVVATDRGPGHAAHTNSATVLVIVSDVNDNPPKFTFPTSGLNTSLGSPVHTLSCRQLPGFVLLTVRAMDKDDPVTENGRYFFSVISQQPLRMPRYDSRLQHGGAVDNGLLKIDPNTGQVEVQRTLSPVDVGEYSVLLRVQDQGTPALSDDLRLRFRVVDSPAQFAVGGGRFEFGNSGSGRYNGGRDSNPVDSSANPSSSLSGSFSLFGDKEGVLVFGLIVMLVVFIFFVFFVAYFRHVRGWFRFLPDMLGGGGGLCGGGGGDSATDSPGDRGRQSRLDSVALKKQAQQQQHLHQHQQQISSGSEMSPRFDTLHKSSDTGSQVFLSTPLLQQQQRQQHAVSMSHMSLYPTKAFPSDHAMPIEEEAFVNYYEILRQESELQQQHQLQLQQQQQHHQRQQKSIEPHYGDSRMPQRRAMSPVTTDNPPQDEYLRLHQQLEPSHFLQQQQQQHYPTWQPQPPHSPLITTKMAGLDNPGSTTTVSLTNAKPSYAVSYPTEQSTFV